MSWSMESPGDIRWARRSILLAIRLGIGMIVVACAIGVMLVTT